MTQSAPEWVTEALGPDHDRGAFSCGQPALDRYLHQQARQDLRRGIAAVFVGVRSGSRSVAGYYALSSAQIELAELPADIIRRVPRYPSVPATLLGRLAVDLSVRGQGLGSYLLIDAFRRVVRAATDVASWAMLVDAIDDEAVRFYEHYGFTRFLDRPSRLFLPMSTVLGVVEGVDSS